MTQTRVLVVDDSASARFLIRQILERDPEILVSGEACNGREAVEMIPQLRPDIVLMDIEMPVMDGITAIEHIMSTNAVPIFVITSRADTDTAYKAVSKGALDILLKPDLQLIHSDEFNRRIKLMSRVRVISHIKTCHSTSPPPESPAGAPSGAAAREQEKADAGYRILAVASSTGGPNALSAILPHLPANFPLPIVVAQHIVDDFLSGMVRWLNGISPLEVKQGRAGEFLRPGTVYFSSSSSHMQVTPSQRIAYADHGPDDIYFPSCDALLSSVARAYGKQAIGLILTGMGSDGVRGMEEIRREGGFTLAQDEESSVIYGMNRAAIEQKVVQSILPVDYIAGRLISLAGIPPEGFVSDDVH